MKDAIGFIAVALVFVSYAPYLRDVLSGKTKPHIYTWFVWGFITTIIFALQLSDGAGTGAYVTLSAGVLSFIVFLLGLKNGTKYITLTDTLFFVSALVATGTWLLAEQPVLSILLLSTIDMLGFMPTVRKAWNKPHEETLFTWELNGFRHGLSIFALQRYTTITLLYPILWTIANLAFSALLVVRRKQLHGK